MLICNNVSFDITYSKLLIQFYKPDSGVHSQNVERMWGSAKRATKCEGTDRNFLGSYLAEFM